ncbi:YcxB family protein [Gaetbulibacter sp. PBL-D1]|uniref:YcxB family protein n=1 Tax=Gaetbulibacter sp. PBL-D1 TaxID=3422594 RepID=UPI003D2EE894
MNNNTLQKIKISLVEKIKIFLNEYYFGYGVFFSILRILGGPLILIMGLNLYFNGITKSGIGYSGFMIFFGIYYLLKPLILVLTQDAWFKNFDLEYKIQPKKIIIQSEKSKSELDYSKLKTVQERKTYFVLKTNSKQGIYLPTKLLETSEIEILNNLKTLIQQHV